MNNTFKNLKDVVTFIATTLLKYDETFVLRWTVNITDELPKNILGRVEFRKSVLSIRKSYAEACIKHERCEVLIDTCLHEIAHILTNHYSTLHGIRLRQQHGPEFRYFCKVLGCDESAKCKRDLSFYCNEKQPKTRNKYKLINKLTGEVVRYFMRKPTRDYSKFYVKGDRNTLGQLVLETI